MLHPESAAVGVEITKHVSIIFSSASVLLLEPNFTNGIIFAILIFFFEWNTDSFLFILVKILIDEFLKKIALGLFEFFSTFLKTKNAIFLVVFLFQAIYLVVNTSS